MLEVEVAGEQLCLLAERAVWWPRRGTLLIADLHLGKAAYFRHRGVPVPEATTQSDLDRLSHILARTAAQRLVILGDLFHARAGRSSSVMAALAAWRQQHRQLAVTVTSGNHDQHAGTPPEAWGWRCEPTILDRPFVCRHHPEPDERGYLLAGHLHPAVRLRDRAAERSRLPCFHFTSAVGVLPAFGSFTGMHTIRAGPQDQVFAVTPNAVVSLAPRAEATPA